MSISQAIGRIVTGTDVEDAMRAHLSTWVPTYIWELERQQGREPGSIPMLRGVPETVTDFEKCPEDQLPCLLLMATGMSDTVIREGSSQYRGKWAIAVGVVASASTQDATNRLAKLYGAAVRVAVMQHRSLGGFARGCDLLDERYDDIPSDDQRTLASVTLVFDVDVPDIMQSSGPRTPSPDSATPPGEFPIVTSTGTIINEESP